MEGATDIFNATLFGNTNLKASKLEAGVVRAYLEESPTARIKAIESVELSSSGSSKTYLYGDPEIRIKDFLDTSQLHKEK